MKLPLIARRTLRACTAGALALSCAGCLFACAHTAAAPPPEETIAATAAAPLPEETIAVAAPDVSRFANTAFFGNSYVEDLAAYDAVGEATCIARVGGTVEQALTQPVKMLDQIGSVPMIDELAGEQEYDAVVLVFGENEMNWNDPDAFSQSYAALLQAVRAHQPSAELYIHLQLPLTKALSDTNLAKGLLENNENVQRINDALQSLATAENVRLLEVPLALLDETGALREDAAYDGVHLKPEECRLWAQEISTVFPDALPKAAQDMSTAAPTDAQSARVDSLQSPPGAAQSISLL